jgi:hypothetical protein
MTRLHNPFYFDFLPKDFHELLKNHLTLVTMGEFKIIDWLDAPRDSTNLMQSPAKVRKQKARTLRDSDWTPHKDRISELYSLHPLKHVINTMETETKFRARCVYSYCFHH